MEKNNQLIRNKLKAVDKPLHWLAHILGISEPTIIRWLRYELPTEKQNEIVEAIDKAISEER